MNFCKQLIDSFCKYIHSLQTRTRFDVNMTSSMMEVCRMTQERYKLHCDVTDEKQSNVRQQFVPYMIRNMAGCCVSFATQTSLSGLHSNHKLTGWFEFTCFTITLAFLKPWFCSFLLLQSWEQKLFVLKIKIIVL